MTPSKPIILVDDEELVLRANEQWLQLAGFQPECFTDPRQALERLQKPFSGILVSDVKMPHMDGLELMTQAIALQPQLPVVLITGHGDVDMAVRSVQAGAYDFIEKPFDPQRLVKTLERAFDQLQLTRQNQQLRERLREQSGIGAKLIGISPAMQQLHQDILEIAALNTHVVIYGETGSGKELVAQSLHEYGQHPNAAFVALNCAAIPESLFESELFGHEAGAFSGAAKRRIGKFEYANGGTLFFDEIESMPTNLQTKVLRAIQEQRIERLGSNQSIELNNRILSASKADLQQLADFRQDLYYRLNISEIHIPPLRDRREDIPLLFNHFSELAANENNLEPRQLEEHEEDLLLVHNWPGNVRELRNIATRFALGKRGLGELFLQKSATFDTPLDTSRTRSLAQKVNSYEQDLIQQSLNKHQGNITEVLQELDLPRRTLNQKMQKYGINRTDFLPSNEEP
ncbi:sigma-54 dependent transcriptional regulator [Aestuariirhabdus sp. Z084]|uniref:sigma-54-dependent transcriptional regulator n=1 Tax=Aestuariirhabdus haliotis TaxID=2918751 RepID=UPI00201B35A8|nr:sigma-54 dependent transcriptional regulator [Aestuariirhabdus haliotis]MCL6414911.1 sigma-54 dependent transcriptional regulator [Aestuariirhabdus haliotis]MCL6418843.1 sigma-54 dependent transcriptional regulator [Aestuariirhabdus haliotis]